jgi:hypothetical protein
MRNILAIAVATSLAATSVVAVQKPVKAPFPYDPIDLPAGVVCSFDVHIQGGGRQNVLTFPGRETIVGSGSVTVSNAATGTSITLDSGGDFTSVEHKDGSAQIIGSGHVLFLLLPGDSGGPGLFQSTGHVVMDYDIASDTVTSIDTRGQLTDVCAAIG